MKLIEIIVIIFLLCFFFITSLKKNFGPGGAVPSVCETIRNQKYFFYVIRVREIYFVLIKFCLQPENSTRNICVGTSLIIIKSAA